MWKNRNVWIILLGEFIAGVGLWTGIIGNLEFMQDKVPSDFLKSLILATGLLAGILAGPLAGRLTDQSRKKTIMLYSGLGRMLSVIFMFIAIATGSIMWMVLFMICIQLSAAFYFPALQSAIPLIVKENQLLQMNSVHMNVSTISRVLGTALAGAMLVVMPLFSVYLASFIAYLFLFVMTLLLKMDEPIQSKEVRATKSKANFKEVLPIISSVPIVFVTLIMSLLPLLFLGGFNLTVINVSEIHDDAAMKGLIYTAEGIAFMLGTFVIKKINVHFSPYTIIFFFAALIGVAQMSLYFVDVQLLALLSFALAGFSVGCFYPTASTIFQMRMPKEFHGRFFSFRNMVDRIVFQVVLLGTGFLLDLVGIQLMSVVLGGLTILLTGYFLLRHKQTRIIEAEQNAVAVGK